MFPCIYLEFLFSISNCGMFFDFHAISWDIRYSGHHDAHAAAPQGSQAPYEPRRDLVPRASLNAGWRPAPVADATPPLRRAILPCRPSFDFVRDFPIDNSRRIPRIAHRGFSNHRELLPRRRHLISQHNSRRRDGPKRRETPHAY